MNGDKEITPGRRRDDRNNISHLIVYLAGFYCETRCGRGKQTRITSVVSKNQAPWRNCHQFGDSVPD